MALFLKQNQERSELQKQVATRLQERLRTEQTTHQKPEPIFLKDQHTTKGSGVLIALLALAVLIVGLYLLRP